MPVDYGIEKSMRCKKGISLSLVALMLLVGGGCLPRSLPPVAAGVTLQPGRYLKEYYRAHDFNPERLIYSLGTFTLKTARGVNPDTFLPLFQTELALAFKANGLILATAGDRGFISGTVQLAKVSGTSLRFLFGKISAELIVSGTITQGEQTLFAFLDRVQVSSPVKPRLAAPKEVELLLQQAAKTFAAHLLTEMLLHGLTPGAG